MGKFSGASAVQRAQEGKLGELELPTGPQVETQVEKAPTSQPTRDSGLLRELRAVQPTPEETQQQVEADTIAATDQTISALTEEVDRQSVPSLLEREQGGPRIDRWLQEPTPPISNVDSSQSPDGNLRIRSKMMADKVANGELVLGLTPYNTNPEAVKKYKEGIRGPELSQAIAETTEGNIMAAVSRSDAVVPNPVTGKNSIDPLYAQLASVVVENEMANIAFNENIEDKDPLFGDDENIQVGPVAPKPIKHATSNSQLGQSIHQEYQRVKGIKVPEKLPKKEAETLGAAFKNLWAEANPDLVDRVVDPKTRQYVYQLTAAGERSLREGEADRKRLFPKVNVRPAKQPLPTGQLPGDVGQNIARKVSGGVGKQEFGNTIQNAMANLATVPNVVDKQRAKILFSTILPVLRDGSHESWQAEINNIGPSKIQKFNAAFKQEQRKLQEEGRNPEEAQNRPEENLATLTDKIAQEVRSIAQERGGANYLSYNVQGFTGRVTPQQSFFNPTTSKAVRFVTRNAVPAIAKPGSKVEKNLRQMYAMSLLPKNLKADLDLPVIREQKLYQNENKLEQWGDRLSEALIMTDEQYESVSQAIEQGIPVGDPNFPQFGGLQLDLEADAELIKHIESKGEDGPIVIDGLIDFSKYIKAKRAGRPYHSYYNGYMDGKTNGLASNGIQMGHYETAERTGVFRSNRSTLLDSGDIRDELKDLAVNSVSDGWDGNTEGFGSELDNVAKEVFGDRDLNKMTTMTFGYGKELDSFTDKINETIFLLDEQLGADSEYSNSLNVIDSFNDRNDLAQTLMNKYESSLREVASEEALEARTLMRSAAALHSATNQIMSIKGPTGMDLNLGKGLTTGYEVADKSTFKIGDKTTTVAHYKEEPTSAAPKKIGDELIPGEYAYGGSVVAPVQALDAATVALSASGKSWDRLRRSSGGNPYIHPIYDAFKVDANGYDTVLEEVNKNWFNSAMNWSYLEATYDATKDAMKKFQVEMKDRAPNEVLTDNERLYMDWLLKPVKSEKGNIYFPNLINKMEKFKDYSENSVWNFSKQFVKEMKAVGYNMYSPPLHPTVNHLKQFVATLAKELNLRPRMEKTIARTNKNKKKLKEEILRRGYKTDSGERIALQYYSH